MVPLLERKEKTPQEALSPWAKTALKWLFSPYLVGKRRKTKKKLPHAGGTTGPPVRGQLSSVTRLEMRRKLLVLCLCCPINASICSSVFFKPPSLHRKQIAGFQSTFYNSLCYHGLYFLLFFLKLLLLRCHSNAGHRGKINVITHFFAKSAWLFFSFFLSNRGPRKPIWEICCYWPPGLLGSARTGLMTWVKTFRVLKLSQPTCSFKTRWWEHCTVSFFKQNESDTGCFLIIILKNWHFFTSCIKVENFWILFFFFFTNHRMSVTSLTFQSVGRQGSVPEADLCKTSCLHILTLRGGYISLLKDE